LTKVRQQFLPKNRKSEKRFNSAQDEKFGTCLVLRADDANDYNSVLAMLPIP